MRSTRCFAPVMAAFAAFGLAAAAAAQNPSEFPGTDIFLFTGPGGVQMPWSSITGPLFDIGSGPSPNTPVSAAGALPVSVSGYTQDVIWDGTAADAAQTGYFDASQDMSDSYALYSAGALHPLPAVGLPTGPFLSATGSGVTFQLQSAEGANALVMTPNSSQGALTLATPGAYKSIALLTASANGDSTVGGVFSYTDGSTTSFSFASPDWYSGGQSAVGTDGRVSYFGIGQPCFQDVETDSAHLYEALLTPDPTRTLAGIDFSAAFTDAHTATDVFAVSGVSAPGTITGGVLAAPEPSQFAGLVLGTLGLAGLGWKARRAAR